MRYEFWVMGYGLWVVRCKLGVIFWDWDNICHEVNLYFIIQHS
jgi:hypothetical protein